jgi:uncharacterized repeat protein (TIGR01451 family)
LFIVLALSLVWIGAAGGEGVPYQQTPGYPRVGCYDVVTAGMGMWPGRTLWPINIRVPGPVVDAYLYWIGTEDVAAPNSPLQSDLDVNGTMVIGDQVDHKTFPASSEWFMWRANIGPGGYNLVSQGDNSFMLSEWYAVPSDVRRNGASIAVVYDTGACARPNQIDLFSSMDWYWERTGGEHTTGAMTFTFPPAPVNREVTVWLNHAGTDHTHPCRPEQVWSASGTGTPPASIIQYGNPSTGINGGTLVIKQAFSQPGCGTTTFPPVTDLYGGYINPQWSVDRVKIVVPAGHTWLAFQVESVYTGASDIEETGESGAWFGQASIPLYNPELRVTKSDGVTLAHPGDTLTYTINYDNHGYGPAQNTTIVDTLPEHATFISATAGGIYNAAARTVTWNLGTVDYNTSGQVMVTVRLDPVFVSGTTTLTNSVTISTTTPGEQDTSDNSATDTTDVYARVVLSLQKTAAPEPVEAGGSLTYTVNWTVGGDAYAPGVVIVDTLPEHVTFVSASHGGVYNAAARTVTWNLGDMTPVTSGAYTINVLVETPMYNGVRLTNVAVITDGLGNRAQGSVTSTVHADHALTVTKTAAPEPVEAGANLTYTINWAVTGNEPSPNATVVDTLPAHVDFVSATGGGVYDPTTRKITWNLGTLMTPQSGSFTVVVAVHTPLYNATVLTNVVDFRDDDPGTTPAQATAQTTVHSDHLLSISKTAAPEPVEAGANLTYTINWAVTGNEPSPNATVVDTLPAHVSFVSATGGGVYDPATHKITWSLGELLTPQSGSFTVVVAVHTPLYNATVLTNVVDFRDDDPGTTPAQATAQTTVHSDHVLSISKTAAPEPVEAGANLTYTINWAVTGNEPSPNATVVDTLPAHVSFVSATGGGVYDPATHKITWSLGELLTPQNGSFTVVVAVDTPLYNGTLLTNTVDFRDDDPGTAPVQSSVTSTVHADHVLSVSKSDSPDPVEAGANLTYTVFWAVTGNEPSPNATIVDALPAHVSFVSATGGGVYDPATRKITWSLGELLTPQNGSFTVVVAVDTPLYNGTLLTNTVDFRDDDPGTAPAQATEETTVHADHVFTISKSDNPDPVEKGELLTYTIDWAVTGNEPAPNTIISDPLPFGVQFVSASHGGVYDPATRLITWSLGELLTPQSGSFTLVVRVNSDFPNGLDIPNQVTIDDDDSGTDPKTASATTRVVQTPEGSIGDTVWYDANSNGIQEPGEPGIPGIGLILYDVGGDGVCGTADDVALGNAVTNSNGQYLFQQVPAGTYCVDVINATVPVGLALTGGTDPHGPILLAEGEAYRDADFGYGPLTGTAAIGDRVWSDANGDGIQDPGEVGIGGVTLSLLSVGPDGLCGTADDTTVATTTTAADGSYLFTGVAPGTYCVQVTDTAGVLTGLTLTGGTNPHGPITVAAGDSYLDADFGYSGAAYTGQIGDLVFYDSNRNGVYEAGPGERGIGGVTLALLSAGADGACGTADDAVIASTVTDANGHYLFDGLPDGTYCVVVTDLNGRLMGYTQTYGVPDTNNNGQISPYTAVISGGNAVLTADFGYADGHLLAIGKVNNLPPGGAVEAGANLIYTLSYGVSGREPAPNVVIRDTLPTNLTFVAASHGGTYNATTRVVTWNLGTLDPGASGAVTLEVTVATPLYNNTYIFNTATIIDDAGVMDEDTDVARVHADHVLSVSKSDAPDPVEAGAQLTYTINWAVTGNEPSPNATVVDTLPAHVDFVSATGNAIYDPATRKITWGLGTLLTPQSGSFTVVVAVHTPLYNATVLTNVVDFRDSDPGTAPVQATAPTTVHADHTLSISKSDAPDPVEAGAQLTYTINWAVAGNEPAPNAIVVDTLPTDVTFVSATGGGVYNAAARTVTWSLGDVMTPQSGSFTVVVTVNSPLPSGTSLTNAVVFSDDDPGTPDAQTSTTTTVHSGHVLAISKADSPDPVEAGANLTFTIAWSATGNEPAPNATIVDTLPEHVTFVSATGGGVYNAAARTVTWNLGTVMTPQSGSFTVVVAVESPLYTGTVLTNVVRFWDDVNTTPVQSSTTTTVHSAPITSLTKTSSPSGVVRPGDTIRYSLCYGVGGNSNATGVTLTDVIPVNTTYVAGSASDGGTYNAATNTLTWNLGTVTVGTNRCVTFDVTVNLTIVGLTGQSNVPLSFAEWNSLSISNTATLHCDQVPDRTATVTNELNATVDPAIYKSTSTTNAHTGETVVFTVTVTNRGNANATQTVITDVIHPKLENVTVTVSKGTGSYDATTRVWTANVGILAPNETVTVVITGMTVRVPAAELPYTITNMATVDFLEGAPRNSNEVSVRVDYFLPGEIPEASTLLLLASGLAGLAGYAGLRTRARQRKAAQ